MQVAIKDVKIGIRRAVDQKNVEMLAESIRAVGLQNPIVLTEDYTLVSGRHRLEAVKSLGHDLVEANILPLSSEEAELAEIDENLIRKDLTVLEQGELLKRRDEILTDMGLRAKQGSQPGNQKASKQENKPALGAGLKTTKEMADEIGVSDRTVRTYKQIASNLTEEVKEIIKETPLANKTKQLLAITHKAPEQQKEIAEIITSGQATTVREAELLLTIPNEPPPRETTISTQLYEVIYADLYLVRNMKNPLKDYQISENATLFLWALEEKLDTAIELGQKWGFKYSRCFIWDKRYDTQGVYHMRNHAHLLIFVKGKHEPTHKKPDWGSIWSQDATSFDVKPPVFKQVIQQLFGDKEILEV